MRRTDKQKTQAAWKRAIERLTKDPARKMNREEAIAFLQDRVEAFAASRLGQSRYVPAPFRWLDNGRYDDDPEAWNRTDDSAPIEQHARALTSDEIKNFTWNDTQ
jgi:hypothetical protein